MEEGRGGEREMPLNAELFGRLKTREGGSVATNPDGRLECWLAKTR